MERAQGTTSPSSARSPIPSAYDLGGVPSVRPDVGGLLPVFVLDRYEGYRVARVQDCTRAELDAWVEANAAAVRAHLPADLVFCNHVLLGGPVGAATGARFAVKAHGSELEYSMRGNERLSTWGRDSLRRAAATFVGSAHIREVLEDVCGHVDRVHEVPPGVDIDDWVPQDRQAALEGLLAAARADPPNPGNANERLPDDDNADRLAAFLEGDGPTVVYFGKLIYNKGVHLLLEALDGLDARAVIVGFGDYRAELEAVAGERALFTGPLEHRHLPQLLALADACVVPSIFPEAFGMVAAEGAQRAARRSSPGTPVSRRSRRAWRRSTRSGCGTWPASRQAMRPTCARSSPSCSPSTRRIEKRSASQPAGRRSSAGAGRASRGACSIRSRSSAQDDLRGRRGAPSRRSVSNAG